MTITKEDDDNTHSTGSTLDRRAALARLGLGAAAVYAAPVLLKLSEACAASGGGSGGADGASGGGDSASGGGEGADAASGDASASGASLADASDGATSATSSSAPTALN